MHQSHGTGHTCVNSSFRRRPVSTAPMSTRREIVAEPWQFSCIPVAKPWRIRRTGLRPPAMNPTTMQQFPTLSAEERRSLERTLVSPVTSLTRSITTEVGSGALYHSVLFPPVRVLDLAHSYAEKSRRVPPSSYGRVRMEHFSENSALKHSTRAVPSAAHAPVSMAYN